MWETRAVPVELRERYLAEGRWTDDTFASFLEREIAAAPDLTFRAWSTVHPWSGTTGALYTQALRLATSLTRLGVRAGDVVCYQVPNWAESVSVIGVGVGVGCGL